MKKHPTHQPPSKSNQPFFRRWDVLIVGILLLACLLWLAITLGQPKGARASVTVMAGDGQTLVQQVRLSKDQIIQVEGAPFPVTLEVKDGAIRFIRSQCPDHRCESFGWLSREGDWALCVPAGVMVRITEDS